MQVEILYNEVLSLFTTIVTESYLFSFSLNLKDLSLNGLYFFRSNFLLSSRDNWQNDLRV
ncbi:hypothetical protein SY86_13480 [Erwinia tracheiphila]|uniref:Uncharacterized protein n=1 Tax=Erwinia tracheiphila TaxID=65700 RepID=A0A0M2KG62_9GAMM|nr:hypothetical protein AV903_16975 [Erwinia tracheiphila]KKF36218.1 hypothetical protein SY86_13480 [Erwinia tracheiphila]